MLSTHVPVHRLARLLQKRFFNLAAPNSKVEGSQKLSQSLLFGNNAIKPSTSTAKSSAVDAAFQAVATSGRQLQRCLVYEAAKQKKSVRTLYVVSAVTMITYGISMTELFINYDPVAIAASPDPEQEMMMRGKRLIVAGTTLLTVIVFGIGGLFIHGRIITRLELIKGSAPGTSVLELHRIGLTSAQAEQPLLLDPRKVTINANAANLPGKLFATLRVENSRLPYFLLRGATVHDRTAFDMMAGKR